MIRFLVFAIWIMVLIIEMIRFSNTIHRVHDFEETLFHIVLIVITLVVGTVGTLNAKKN
ncbi:hypothetical protein Pjdr2_3646 [Paenibacillus sp. JDR-2]|nr:hypothetical protein Pjdr2_3646 [Paenibacillus sp. JDR-2]